MLLFTIYFLFLHNPLPFTNNLKSEELHSWKLIFHQNLPSNSNFQRKLGSTWKISPHFSSRRYSTSCFKYCLTRLRKSCSQLSAHFMQLQLHFSLSHCIAFMNQLYQQITINYTTFIWTNNFRSPRTRTLWCVSMRLALMERSEAIVAFEAVATAVVVSRGAPRFLVADSASPRTDDVGRSYGCYYCWSNWYLYADTTANDCCCRFLGCNGPDGYCGGSVLTSSCWCSSPTPTCSANRTIV